MSSPTVFIVASFGRSGTVWLSKVLNSNPDVHGFHEGVMTAVHPRFWIEAGMKETEDWIEGIKQMSPWDVGLKTYAAVGDLNSFFGFHRTTPWENEFFRAAMRPRQEKMLEGTRVSFMARNPIISVESKWRLMQPIWDCFWDYALWYGREMIRLNPETLGEFEPEIVKDRKARAFFMLLLHLRCTVRFGYPRIYRMEELTSSPEAAARACEEITGVPYSVDGIARAHGRRENAQTHAHAYERNDEVIWKQWPPAIQRMFSRLCADLPARLGYDPVAPSDEVIDRVVGLDSPENPAHVPCPYPVASYREEHKFAARLRDLGFAPQSIVDVGGSNGSWSLHVARLFPQAQISVFEPLADLVPHFDAGLKVLQSTHPGVAVFKVALGDANAKQAMFLGTQPERSSLLPLANGLHQAKSVMKATLDSAVQQFQIAPPAMLKIDVNGYELQVLKGATKALVSVEVLFLETWLQRMNGAGTTLLPEAVDWLSGQGLYLAEVLDEGACHDGLPVSRRAVFMRERNRYFKKFGQRGFRAKMADGLVPPA